MPLGALLAFAGAVLLAAATAAAGGYKIRNGFLLSLAGLLVVSSTFMLWLVFRPVDPLYTALTTVMQEQWARHKREPGFGPVEDISAIVCPLVSEDALKNAYEHQGWQGWLGPRLTWGVAGPAVSFPAGTKYFGFRGRSEFHLSESMTIYIADAGFCSAHYRVGK